MFDFDYSDRELSYGIARASASSSGPSFFFNLSKRVFDICVSAVVLLPLTIFCALLLLLLNPFWNRGPLIFSQVRMGRNCRPFIAYKFRSMRPAQEIQRSADCPLEEERITPLGRFLRKSRIDELPQIINVFKGEMSLIGPRPDYIKHARKFLADVPGYQDRHAVRPGISGWAQVELGYIEGVEATRKKVLADLHYISNASFAMEARIVWRTLNVIARRGGA